MSELVYFDVYRDKIRIADTGDKLQCQIGTFRDAENFIWKCGSLKLRCVSIRGRISNLEFVRHLNEFSEIYKLDLPYLNNYIPIYNANGPVGDYQCDILSILEDNTTIKELHIGSTGEDPWPAWHKFFTNTTLTHLCINSLIRYSTDAAPLLVSNSTLRALSICLTDNWNNILFTTALLLNTYITSLALHLRFDKADSDIEQNIMNCIRRASTLKSLALTWANVSSNRGNNIAPSSAHVEKLWPALAVNTSLRDVQMHFTLYKLNFQNIISQNLTITSFDCGYEMHGDITQMFAALSLRNQKIMWRNVHPVLLDFTLIFYFLPPYIVLEIYDHLEFMDLVPHYPKIKLIISIKNSILKCKN